MPGPAPHSASPDPAPPTLADGLCAEQLYRAVLDGDEARVRALLTAVLGVNGRLLLERQQAQLNLIESLLTSMRRLAFVDALTGAYNRRGFMHVGARALEELGRNLRSALVLYVDVDDIKRVNDTGGHEAGDRQLCDAIAVLERATGPGAILGRLGGDEFAAVVRGSAADHGALLERIQQEITACNTAGRWPQLSLSVGVTVFDPLRPTALDVLLGQADRAMYQDKTGKFQRHLRAQIRSL